MSPALSPAAPVAVGVALVMCKFKVDTKLAVRLLVFTRVEYSVPSSKSSKTASLKSTVVPGCATTLLNSFHEPALASRTKPVCCNVLLTVRCPTKPMSNVSAGLPAAICITLSSTE